MTAGVIEAVKVYLPSDLKLVRVFLPATAAAVTVNRIVVGPQGTFGPPGSAGPQGEPGPEGPPVDTDNLSLNGGNF